MQLMTFNSLLMFDIVFVFFLFLVGVTCLVYYLPPSKGHHCRHNTTGHHQHYHHSHQQSLNSHRNKFVNYRPHRECCASNLKIITSSCGESVELYTPDCSIDVEKSLPVASSIDAPQCCYVKAKPNEVKDSIGPIQDV